jgi:hypothetical protein
MYAQTSLAAELVRRQFTETDVPAPAPRAARLPRTRLALAGGLLRVARAVHPGPAIRLRSGAWQG